MSHPITIAAPRTADPPARVPRWTPTAVAELMALPFADLMLRAQQVHRAHHEPHAVQ
jgi:biotin synthase